MKRLPIIRTGETTFITVGEYLGQRQPEEARRVWQFWPVPVDDGEELTSFQRFVEKLMRQTPRPGKGGGGI